MAGTVHIGTSGWHYKHWLGDFYPEKLPAKEMLNFYTQHFDTVEINNTFYHLPANTTFNAWRDNSPENFVYALKGSRFITHMKKLKDPESSTAKFFEGAELLETKLGPILFQLPPRWQLNLERLEEFLEVLPQQHHYTLNFGIPVGWSSQFMTCCNGTIPHFVSTISRVGLRRLRSLRTLLTCVFMDRGKQNMPARILTAFCKAGRERLEIGCVNYRRCMFTSTTMSAAMR